MPYKATRDPTVCQASPARRPIDIHNPYVGYLEQDPIINSDNNNNINHNKPQQPNTRSPTWRQSSDQRPLL
jgi:hypothetical protein